MIEAVVVDLGGVAARFTPERRLRALASLTGVGEGVVQARLFDSGFERRAELGEYSFEQVVEQVGRIGIRPGATGAIVEAWAQAFEPETEVLDCIASLPVKKVLFTNNGPMIDACLAGPLRGLASVFDDVICSWHLGARKPDAVAFERAAERTGCGPERLLLLDDRMGNVEGARRCGWGAELVTGAIALGETLNARLHLLR